MHYLRSLIFFLLLISNVQAITLAVSPLVRIDLTDEAPTQAGEYLKSSYENIGNRTLISVKNIDAKQAWVLCVRQPENLKGLTINVKRLGQGIGRDKIKDGKRYQKLAALQWNSFFSGKGEYTNIPVQTRVSKIGVSDSYGNFKTKLEYKVNTYTDNKSCD